MTGRTFDIVVIGAGSVGNPAAMFLAERGLRVLVIDELPSPGQGQNKAAIGGARATHSDAAKITLCLRSLEIFSSFEERRSHYLGWKKGGYCFPVYLDAHEEMLRNLLETQKAHGLDIDWHGPDRIGELVPGINEDGLRGGTYSPGDGQVSPLLCADAFFKVARECGAEYRFGERVTGIAVRGGRVAGVSTDKDTYAAGAVLNAAGAHAREIGGLTGLDVPVDSDSHEAGISAPVEQFLGPLIVDVRAGPDGKTAGFYFGQNSEGRLLFCYTPGKPFAGEDRESTSGFLPVMARRLIDLIPPLKNLLVRRVWRGLYPMTPDGVPIVDKVEELEGMYLGVGMCGQGFMLGPGVAECLAGLIADGRPTIDEKVFDTLSFYRDFHAGRKEALE